VIYGASGYTGQWVVEETARVINNKEKGLTWAVAGRNKAKLEEVLSKASKITGLKLQDVPIIEADNSKENSLVEMARKAKVVLNCVGPYRFYGEAVVKACVQEGANHIDISGEPQYIETMQLKYGKEAAEKGIYIISACGYDSIPADLGLSYLANQFQGDVNSIEVYMKFVSDKETSGPVANIGTWLSLINGIKNWKELKDLRKQIFTEKLPALEPKLQRRSTLHYNSDVKSWCLLFPGPDYSIIKRSQYWFFTEEKRRPIQAGVYFQTNLFGAITLMLAAAFLFIMSLTSFTINLMKSIRVSSAEDFSAPMVRAERRRKKRASNSHWLATVGRINSPSRQIITPIHQMSRKH